MYALFQHDLKRLLALHSIENVGIIVLGLGACLRPARARRRRRGRRSRSRAALLHTLNHAVFKALLFLGAGAFERAVGSLELDRLGGLLRRMPWTGGAFLVGAMAIAGLPPLNGFASEWLTLQALLHVPSYGGVGDGIAGRDRAGRARGDRGAGRLLLRQGRRPRAARPAAARRGEAVEAPLAMRAAVGSLAVACVVLGLAPGLAVRLAGRARALGRRRRRRGVGLDLPGTGSLPTAGIAVVLVALTAGFVALRGRRSAAPAPSWACGQLVEPRLELDERRVHEAAPARARGGAAPAARDRRCAPTGGVVQEVSYSGHVPHLIDEHVYRPVDAARARGGGAGAAAAERAASACTSRT